MHVTGTIFKSILLMLCLFPALAPGATGEPAHPVTGTFLQLNRAMVSLSADDWSATLDKMKAIGINTIIIQWCAEEPISYFRNDLSFPEQHEVIERIFAAAGGKGFTFYLGLQNDPAYWQQIQKSENALREYFQIRVARNERLQKALTVVHPTATEEGHPP